MSKKRRNPNADPQRTKPLPDVEQENKSDFATPGPKVEKPQQLGWTAITQTIVAIAGLLTAIGAILGVLNQAGLLQSRTPTVTATMVATFTPPPATDAPTLTPLPTLTSTPTLTPSPTPTTTPTVTPTQLPVDCLSSQEWQFYPLETVNQAACLDLLPYFISYDGQQFDFNAQRFEEINVYGVSREIPRNATIEATFSVGSVTGGGRLWFAISSDVDPKKESVVFVILPDKFVALRGFHDGVERNIADPHKPVFDDFSQKQYKVKVALSGSRVDIDVNGVRFSSTAIGFSTRRLFIGYQSVRDTRLTVSAKLSGLTIK